MTDYLITNARVLDGTGREPFSVAVRVEGERIAAVTPRAAPPASGASLIDAAGATLMPGLADVGILQDRNALRLIMKGGALHKGPLRA